MSRTVRYAPPHASSTRPRCVSPCRPALHRLRISPFHSVNRWPGAWPPAKSRSAGRCGASGLTPARDRPMVRGWTQRRRAISARDSPESPGTAAELGDRGKPAGKTQAALLWFLRYRGNRGMNCGPSEGQPEVLSSDFVSLIPIRFGARRFRLPPPSADVRCDDNHRQDGHGAYQGDQPYRPPLLRFRRRRRGQGSRCGRWGRRRCGR